jgi:hypothetical protein
VSNVGKTLVKGHTLRFEGMALYDDDGSGIYGWSRTGRGECSCGERSPVLESNAARKRWHREHKAEVSS